MLFRSALTRVLNGQATSITNNFLMILSSTTISGLLASTGRSVWILKSHKILYYFLTRGQAQANGCTIYSLSQTPVSHKVSNGLFERLLWCLQFLEHFFASILHSVATCATDSSLSPHIRQDGDTFCLYFLC